MAGAWQGHGIDGCIRRSNIWEGIGGYGGILYDMYAM